MPIDQSLQNRIWSRQQNSLNDIIADVSRKTEVNQWRNTATVINWFKNLSDKHKRKFIKLDIAEFYPSISENF